MLRPTHIAALGLCAFAALSLAIPALAQDEAAAPLHESLGAAKGRLNLTPQQEAQLAPLMKEEADKLRAIREKYGLSPSPDERRAKYEAAADVRRNFRAKLNGVLTPEQLTEWDKMRAEALTRAQQQRLNQ
jgi:hypothetical protein